MIRSTIIAAAVLLLAAGGTDAQAVPGRTGTARAGSEVREYRARTRAEVRRILNLLEDGWAARSPAAISRLFASDAMVLAPGGAPVPAAEVGAWLQAELDRDVNPTLRIDDFDTSGDLAFAACSWMEGPAADAPRRIALLVLRRGRFEGEWEIRSLTLTSPEAAQAPPAADAL